MIILALAGAWVCASLTRNHDGGWQVGPVGLTAWLCPPARGDASACSEVLASRWGSFDFFVGERRVLIPTSLVGLTYFVGATIWLVMVPFGTGASRWINGITRGMVCCGFVASVFLVGVMALRLSEWCGACLIVHGINTAMVLGTLMLCGWRWGNHGDAAILNDPTTLLGRRFAIRSTGCAAAFSLAAAVAIWLYFDAAGEARMHWRRSSALGAALDQLQSDKHLVLREFFAQPTVDIPLPLLQKEYEAPRMRVVVFNDYACSACACFDRTWRNKIRPLLGLDVLVEHRHFPENPGDLSGSTRSQRGSLAVEAARSQGGDAAADRMHALVFKHRKNHEPPDHRQLAQSIGLNPKRFETDFDSESVRAGIERDRELAESLGIQATPAVFVNGRRVPDLCLRSSTFWAAIGRGERPEFNLASLAPSESQWP